MAKIDTSNWKKFKITDLFTPVLTDGNNRPQLMKHGSIPLVVSQDKNNGILDYFKSDTKIFPAKSITLDMFGHAFAQNKPYQTVSHGRVNVLLPKFKQSFYVSLFLASVITKQCSTGFDYKQMISLSKTKRLTIKLPVDSQGQPDWAFMDSYIAKKREQVCKKLASLQEIKLKKHKLDISKWGKFKISDLFNIDSGNKFDKRRVILTENKNINFIGRTGDNNGIITECGIYRDTEPYSAGLITVSLGGTVGATFVQNKPFYTSQNVIVLKPKHMISWAIKQFIATCIYRESLLNYQAFRNELNAHIKRDFSFKLPVTSTGQPDWQYMDNYIAHKRQQVKLQLNILEKF